MKSSLKVGYTLTRYGIDSIYGAILMTIAWIIIELNTQSYCYLLALSFVMFIIAMIFFGAGRIVVGLQARKINFSLGRQRTEEEQWFLNENLALEDEAGRASLACQLAKISPDNSDDIIIASQTTGIIKHWFALGKVYMGKNVLINRLVLIISVLNILFELVVKMILN